MHFRGNGDYSQLPALLKDGDWWTVVIVASPNQTTRRRVIINNYWSVNGIRFDTDYAVFVARVNNTNYAISTAGIYTIETNKVYLLAMSVGYNNRVNAYVNGEKVGETADLGSYTTTQLSGYSFRIGAQTVGPLDYYLSGDIYLTAIYSEAKSDDWVSAFYNDWKNGRDLRKYIDSSCRIWLDGDSIDTANGKWWDMSPYHNDGTIYGATLGSAMNDLNSKNIGVIR